MSGRYSEQFYLSPSLGNDGLTQNPTVKLDGTVAVSTAIVTVPISVKDVDAYSIQLSTPAGSTLAVGAVTFEVSNDRGAYEQTAGGGDIQMTDWTVLSFWDVTAGGQVATKALTSGLNNVMISERGCTYRYVRVRLTTVSGSGLLRVSFQQKGWA